MRGLSTSPTPTRREHCSPRRRGLGAKARGVAMDLTPQAVEQIATQVVRLLDEREARDEPGLLSAGELARRLRVERPWVYRNRHLLGGVRMGTGPKARWRFDFKETVNSLRHAQMNDGEGDLT